MNIALYGIIALLLVALVLGVGWDVEYRRAQTLTTELATAQQQITVDGTALTQEKLTAAAFEAAAKDWQAKCGTVPEANQAAAQLVALQAQLTQARRDLSAAETKDAKLPQCETLLNQDLGAACPDVAGGLRGLSGAPGDVRGSAGAGAGSGGAAAAAGAPH